MISSEYRRTARTFFGGQCVKCNRSAILQHSGTVPETPIQEMDSQNYGQEVDENFKKKDSAI